MQSSNLIHTLIRALAAVLVAGLALRGAITAYYDYIAPKTPAAADSAVGVLGSPVESAQQARQVLASVSTLEAETQRAQAIVSAVSGGKSQVQTAFAAPGGLTGVVVKGSEQGQFVAWLIPGVDYLFVGAAFDKAGKNITQQETIQRGLAEATIASPIPKGTAQRLETMGEAEKKAAIARAVERAAGAPPEGTGGPLVHVFYDAACPACSVLWQKTRLPVATGQLRVRWIPVAVVDPQKSPARAKTILSAADPTKTILAIETKASSGMEAIATPNAEAQLEANNALLRLVTSGEAVTPLLFTFDKRGQTVVARGAPSDMAAFIGQIQ